MTATTKDSDLGNCCSVIGDIRELESHGWRQIARELASAPHGREHAHAPVIDLCPPLPYRTQSLFWKTLYGDPALVYRDTYEAKPTHADHWN